MSATLRVRLVWIFRLWVPDAEREGLACSVFTHGLVHCVSKPQCWSSLKNAPRFPIAFLVSLFGDMYSIDHIIIDDKDFESPARRRRLYVVMTLRGKLCLSQPLANLVTILRSALPSKRSWDLLFFSGGR